MNNFLSNIKAKGWDKFLLDVQNEFKSIREDLSISNHNCLDISLLNSTNSSVSNVYDDLNIKTETEIKKEFVSLREDLNIDSFVI